MTSTLGQLAAFAWALPMIAALFMVVRDRTLRFRILWAPLCFVGVGAFWMERSTGKWGFEPLAINLLVGAQPGFHKATIPAGALAVFAMLWLRARKTRA